MKNAHVFNLSGITTEFTQLVLSKQELRRYLIVICAREKSYNADIVQMIQLWKMQGDECLPVTVRSTSSRFSRMLSTLAVNLLHVEESIISV